MNDDSPKLQVRIIQARRQPRHIPRVALYCRMSTQVERQTNSLSAQMDFLKYDTLEYPGWEYEGTYTDIGRGHNEKHRQK